MTDETILSRIKKLLALSRSDNENEAASAAAAAQNLLLKYNVSEEELSKFSDHTNEVVIEVITEGKNKNNRVTWQDVLVGTVAKANLCRVLLASYGTGYIWIGKATNIEVAQYIFSMLCNDLQRLCDGAWYYFNAEQMARPKWSRIHGKQWKNSFYHGANQTIRERLTANLLSLKEAESVNALVLRNDQEIEEFTKLKYPRLYTHALSFNKERSGFEAGKAAGRQLQFRQGLSAGGASQPKRLTSGR